MPVASLLNRRLLAPLLILGLGGALAVVIATGKPAPAPEAAHPPALPRVQVMAAVPQTLRLPVATQGAVAPRREIDLVAQVGGRITAVAPGFVNGAFFSAGETLVTIEPRDYELALIQAGARVSQARQELATTRGQARQAQREWRDLGNSDANALFLRKPQLAAAEAALAAAEAERDQARLNLQRTAIAPLFAGRIRETYVDLGQYVTPGTKVARIYDTAVAEVRLPLTDAQAALLELPLNTDPAQPARPLPVTLSGTIAGRVYTWAGQITRTEASLDTRSRQYIAIAEVTHPFRPGTAGGMPMMVGLFVEAEIAGRQLDDVITLPRSAVFSGNQLLMVESGDTVRRVTVEVLARTEQEVVIRAPLPAGTRVVLEQQSLLADGVQIAPVSAP